MGFAKGSTHPTKNAYSFRASSGAISLPPSGARAAAARSRGTMSSTRSALRTSMFNPGRMNSVSRICASSVISGSQKAVDVGEQHRLGVTAELLPGHLLDQFLQRADAAGQRHERIGVLEHQPLALVHVGRDDHLLNTRQHIFARPQKIRNDAGHQAAVIQRAFRDRTHQPDRAAAIDQPDIVFSENFSQRERSFDEAGARARPGTAIDTDSFDLIHAVHVALHPGKLKSDSLRRCSQDRPEIKPNGGKIYLSRLYGRVKRSI